MIESDFYEQSVKNKEKFPQNAMYIALVFKQGSQHVPAYDRHDPPEGTYCPTEECDAYVFGDKETLDMFAMRAMHLNMKYVMFELGSQLTTHVTVDVKPKMEPTR